MTFETGLNVLIIWVSTRAYDRIANFFYFSLQIFQSELTNRKQTMKKTMARVQDGFGRFILPFKIIFPFQNQIIGQLAL